MIEENYLSYPQAVKEAMGQQVDYTKGDKYYTIYWVSDGFFMCFAEPTKAKAGQTLFEALSEAGLIFYSKYEDRYIAGPDVTWKVNSPLTFEGWACEDLTPIESCLEEVITSDLTFIPLGKTSNTIDPFGPSIGGGGGSGNQPPKIQP